MKKQAECVWRESVTELRPLRNGRENLGRKYMARIGSYRNWVASLEEFIAFVLSAMKIHDEYRINGTKMTSK